VPVALMQMAPDTDRPTASVRIVRGGNRAADGVQIPISLTNTETLRGDEGGSGRDGGRIACVAVCPLDGPASGADERAPRNGSVAGGIRARATSAQRDIATRRSGDAAAIEAGRRRWRRRNDGIGRGRNRGETRHRSESSLVHS
jgi:hypothetical protein